MVPVLVCALFFSLYPPYDPEDSSDVADVSPPHTSVAIRQVVVERPSRGSDIVLDDLTAYRLERKLMTDPWLAPHVETVTVDVVDGRVTLRGIVDPRWRSAVILAAAETSGVTSIRDAMHAANEP